jgi:hypothetical protein
MQWKPESLLRVKPGMEINLGEQVTTLIFSFVFLVLLNLPVAWWNGYIAFGSFTLAVPVFGAGFQDLSVPLSIGLLASAALSVILIITKKMNFPLLIVRNLLRVYAVVMIILVIGKGTLFRIETGGPVREGAEGLQKAFAVSDIVLKAVLIFIIVVLIIEGVREVIAFKRTREFWEEK